MLSKSSHSKNGKLKAFWAKGRLNKLTMITTGTMGISFILIFFLMFAALSAMPFPAPYWEFREYERNFDNYDDNDDNNFHDSESIEFSLEQGRIYSFEILSSNSGLNPVHINLSLQLRDPKETIVFSDSISSNGTEPYTNEEDDTINYATWIHEWYYVNKTAFTGSYTLTLTINSIEGKDLWMWIYVYKDYPIEEDENDSPLIVIVIGSIIFISFLIFASSLLVLFFVLLPVWFVRGIFSLFRILRPT
ncbi:MAG: hypothetical protein ACW99Q_21175 [Candidatus Kariarchaeaceae archaeon]|jgi:hypothetical protein